MRWAVLWAVIGAAALPAPSAACTITESDRTEIGPMLERYAAHVRAEELAALTRFTPFPIFEHLAAEAGVPTWMFVASMARPLAETNDALDVVSFDYDLGDASEGCTSEDRPFLLVPARTVIDVGEPALRRKDVSLLVMPHDGAWRIVRVSEPRHEEILSAVFPDFAGVPFPPGTLEILE